MTNSNAKANKNYGFPNYDSNIFLTQYSAEASRLIKSFTKSIPFVVIMLTIIAVMTLFDLTMDLGLITRVLSDETIDTMIISVSILLIIILILGVRFVIRSQKILNKWSNLFANNAIRIGILLTINNKNKEEVLNALSETINEINIPLQQYLSKSKNQNEFYNISIDENSSTTFDILIDKSTINSTINFVPDANSLRNIIQDYGSILVKILENSIDDTSTQAFIEAIQKYKRQRSHKIGLAILIGNSIQPESYKLIDKIKDKNIRENLIMIEKPDSPDLSLHALSNA